VGGIGLATACCIIASRPHEVGYARAQIYLACETLRPHLAVIVLNDRLREQLDRLAEEDC
jgi:hypothetical protein